MENYAAKGYIQVATETKLELFAPEQVWYLPISVGVQPKKPGKVRLVWD